MADVDSNLLTIELTKNKKEKLPKEELKFGVTTTDHMLEVDWNVKTGFGAPRITPYHNLSIDPASSSLHYALQCFEGMKAYIDDNDQIRMFRPMENMKRMNKSLDRLYMPQFDKEEWLACIKELLKVEKEWIPKGMGYSLYIRPTGISTHPFIGVGPAASCKLFVICSPVGPYYPTGFAPIKLLADPKYVRAWPGGTGNTKIGGNYAMGMQAGIEAQNKGYSQMLWLFGDNHEVTEVGTMNQFFVWINKDGEKEMVTAPLDGTILPGVTRDSVLQLARSWNEFKVTERVYNIHEIIEAIEEGRMIEAFGSGTAAIVSPVEGFKFLDTDYAIPLDKDNSSAKAGPITIRVSDAIQNCQYGKGEDPFGWSVVVE